MRDPYRVLSVARDADRDEIHRAFRALARELHPDRGGDPALMQAINDAWAILSRPTHRRAYDEARAAAIERARLRKAKRVQAAQAAREGRTVAPAGTDASGTAAPSPPRPPVRERRPDALDYGRYEGWTIRELAQEDPDYLLWLARTPAGADVPQPHHGSPGRPRGRMAGSRPTTLATRTGRGQFARSR